MVDIAKPGGTSGASSVAEEKKATVKGVKGCPACNGDGGWEDCKQEMSVMCPICRAFTAEHYAMAKFKMHSWVPDFQQIVARYIGPAFSQEPWLLVVHSGSLSDRVAEYLANPGDDRQVSAHVSYSRTYKDFVQQVPFNRVAWHVGGSIIKINKKRQGRLNFCSIGIERPGPPGKHSDDIEGKFVVAIEKILRYNPSLKVACRHSDIDPNKSDPGIDIRFLSDYGLEVYGG